MKIAIIGAGNMGGAIAKGLAQGTVIAAGDIWVSNPSLSKLDDLKAFDSRINTTTDNQKAVDVADWVILAVKPWLIDMVVKSIKFRPEQVVISIAAGVTFEALAKCLGYERTIFRMIPNTAISELSSMTLISSRNASAEQEQIIFPFSMSWVWR